MIKNKKTIGFSFIALTGLIAVATCVGVYTPNLINMNNVGATEYGDNPGTTKRIYVLIDDSLSWWNLDHSKGNTLLFHYWGGSESTDWNDRPKMNFIGSSQTINSGFEYGLYYYDVPADTTWMLIDNTSTTGANGNEKTGDIQLNYGSEMYFFLLKDGGYGQIASYENGVFINNSLSSQQLAEVLSHKHIDTCSQSTASGYNSYNQIYKIFLEYNEYDMNTIVDKDTEYEATLEDIISAMQARSAAGSNQVN